MKMMKRCSGIPSPLAAAVLLLLLACFLHGAAAVRLLPAVHPPLVHKENGVKAAAVDEPPVLQNGATVIGDDLSVSEMMGEEAEEAACEEGNDDECLQRRLLRDAHLDYIYTQHKGGKQP